MAQKCRKSRMSSGKQSKINAAKEVRRQAEFAKKRDEGITYKYKLIPHVRGTVEYNHESLLRAEKNVDRKTPVARMTSIMRKLENEVNKQKLERKSAKVKKSDTRVKTA